MARQASGNLKAPSKPALKNPLRVSTMSLAAPLASAVPVLSPSNGARQVGYHLLAAAHRTHAPWPMVAAVACLPVITLGFGAALAHLLHSTEPEPGTEAVTPSTSTPQVLPNGEQEPTPPSPKPPAELIDHARVLDMQHRHANRGRPISRDKLKATLGIATNTASTLTRIIRTEQGMHATTERDEQPPAADLPHAS
jgi:hypothetical protein